ncbi:MAG: hypothetical protein RIS35_3797 [Pseudomonadota bacterium]
MTISPPPPLRIFDAASTAAALPYGPLVEALRAMMLRREAGRTLAPERLVIPLKEALGRPELPSPPRGADRAEPGPGGPLKEALAGGTLLVMPATDGEYASTKLVTVHAGNPQRGLPSLLGEVILMRAQDGVRLAMFDGPTLTARRTAALSVLGARTFAPAAKGPMLIVGAGAQARGHLEAFADVVGVSRVTIASRTLAKAEALAAHARALGIDADATVDPMPALERSTIIVTATTSLTPVFADRVREDAFIAAVGAYRPEMCELPAALLQRSTVFVDDLAGARHEAGDLIQAGIDWERIHAIEEVLAGDVPTPTRSPIVFKTVGQALWDLAAARLGAGVDGGAVRAITR